MRKSLVLASSLLAFSTAVSAQATTAYLIDSNLDQLFSVDLSSGAATFLVSTANNGLATPAGLAWRGSTQELWTIDLAGGAVGTIDTTNGTFTSLFSTALSGWQGIAWDEVTQKFYLANQSGQLYVLDPTTGTTTPLGPGGTGLITTLDCDAAGNLFGIEFSSGFVYQFDTTTGVSTQLSTTRTGIQGSGIDASTGVWYGADTNTDSLYTIDPLTGANVLVGAHGAGVQFAKGFDLIDSSVGNVATKTLFGAGCYRQFASFYELFANGTFDLSNTSWSLLPSGGGYLVLPTSTGWFTPASLPITLGDDSVSPPQNLGFTLTYPGGSTSAVTISSNGFVWAQSNTVNGCCSGSPPALLTGGARWCALWNDLNPGAGGAVHFDQDPANGAAYVTFTGVPEYGNSNSNTFQIGFFNSGIVELRFQTCTVTAHQVLTGFSPGAANLDPGTVDISTVTALQTSATDVSPPSLDAGSRPVLGTTVSMNLTNIPAGAPFAAFLYGITKFDPGLSLANIGMPGCLQFTSQEVTVPAIAPGATASSLFPIPNSTAYSGVRIVVQGAVYDPAGNHNPLGALSSNGVELLLDIN